MPFGQLASAVNALNGNLAAGWDAFTGNSGQSFSIPDGIVLDYQEVGLLGIIDYSNQANNATHYSGRGVTMDAATNTITYPTGYGSAERTATVWMRVGTLGARTLNGASGTFTFTPTATGVWEQLSSTATVSGNLSWTAGSDCDIADLQIGTAHWPHADWSDPTASGLNGKTIVDVGPDDFHGVCTGCNGFTEEATIPQTGNRNWNKYQHFGGATSIVSLNSTITLTGDFSVDFAFTYDGSSAVQEYTGGLSTLQRFLYNGSNSTFFLANGVSTATFSGIVPVVGFNTINISRTGSLVTLTLNEGTDSQTFAADFVISQLGARFGNTNNVIGIITSININNQTTYTGLGNDPWADTTGSNDGTESGAFTRQLALASDANDQVDAYGTAILKPRLNNQTFNGFDDGEKWTTPDATSLDAVKTFIGFVFYDGVNDTTWLDLTAADTIIINASSGVLASSGITSPTYYTNGAAGTALNTGWNHVMVTTATAVNCGPIDGENRNGSIQFYTDVKLAAFALEEYNFNKSNYGL